MRLMAWKLLTLVVAILLANALVFGILGTLAYGPTPTATRTPHTTFTPNPALVRRYASPTPTPTITPTPAPPPTPQFFPVRSPF